VAPFALSFLIRRILIAQRGSEYFFGPFSSSLGEAKLWVLVVVIVSLFASQDAILLADFGKVGVLIGFLIGFFLVVFVLALVAGRVFRLSYEDNATLAFTTTARNSELVIGIAVAAFPGHPLVYLAIILGPIVELPILLLIARVMLAMRQYISRNSAPEGT
jgi:ACR3 family arsenite efflux pump ArsB